MIEYLLVKRFQLIFTKINHLIEKIIYPKFLKNFEPHLLLHHPKLWESKFWIVFYHVLLFIIMVTPFVAFVPVEPHQISNIWVSLAIILGVELFMYRAWTNKIRIYNLEKNYGISNPRHGWIEFGLYLLCTGFILVTSYCSFFVFQHRLASSINNVDLENFNGSIQSFLSSFDSSQVTTCEEAIKVVNVSISADLYGSIALFSGDVIFTNEQAAENICLAANNATSAYNFISSDGHQNIWSILHLTLFFYGAWFIFACKHVWQTPSDVFMVPWAYAFLGFTIWVSITIVFNLLNIGAILFPNGIDILTPIIIWGISTIVFVDVLLIPRLEKYSSISAYSVTVLPICLILSFFMLTYIFPLTFDSTVIVLTIPVLIWFILIPYLKAKYLLLLSLPTE